MLELEVEDIKLYVFLDYIFLLLRLSILMFGLSRSSILMFVSSSYNKMEDFFVVIIVIVI